MIDHYPDPNGLPTYRPAEALARSRGAAMYREARDPTPSIRVRVTRRIQAQTGSIYDRPLLARAGEELSLADAVARGIPADALEATTVQGAAGLRAWVAAAGSPTSLPAAQAVAHAAETGTGEPDDAGDVDTDGYPHHRGGPYWTLSNGETFRGTRDDAAAAQAALTADTAGEGEPS